MDSLLDIQPLRTTAAHTQVSFNIYPSICKSSARIHEHENVYICMRMRPCVLGLRFNLKSAGKPEHICHPHGFLLFHTVFLVFLVQTNTATTKSKAERLSILSPFLRRLLFPRIH